MKFEGIAVRVIAAAVWGYAYRISGWSVMHDKSHGIVFMRTFMYTHICSAEALDVKVLLLRKSQGYVEQNKTQVYIHTHTLWSFTCALVKSHSLLQTFSCLLYQRHAG